MVSKEILDYQKTLSQMGIETTIVEHPELKTPPETLKYLGFTLAEGVSTMIMKSDDAYVAILAATTADLTLKKLNNLWAKMFGWPHQMNS